LLGRVAVFTAVVVIAVCTALYFLFFAAPPVQKLSAMALPANAVSDPSYEPPTPTASPAPQQGQQDMEEHVITVNMEYDSGEGVYTGELKDGVPHGQGSFTMQKSESGLEWSYQGQWENGEITGQGVLEQPPFVFKGGFRSGLLDGACTVTDNGILRYQGMCKDGKLHGEGTLYTQSGRFLFSGSFERDMIVESAIARKTRGEAFAQDCDGMDEHLYADCFINEKTFGYPVAVWGYPIAMSEQKANGTIVIGHMGENEYPVCLVYRYGTDEPKMARDDWINAWGVVVGIYEYMDADGLTVACPKVEVVYWRSERNGF